MIGEKLQIEGLKVRPITEGLHSQDVIALFLEACISRTAGLIADGDPNILPIPQIEPISSALSGAEQ